MNDLINSFKGKKLFNTYCFKLVYKRLALFRGLHVARAKRLMICLKVARLGWSGDLHNCEICFIDLSYWYCFLVLLSDKFQKSQAAGGKAMTVYRMNSYYWYWFSICHVAVPKLFISEIELCDYEGKNKF